MLLDKRNKNDLRKRKMAGKITLLVVAFNEVESPRDWKRGTRAESLYVRSRPFAYEGNVACYELLSEHK